MSVSRSSVAASPLNHRGIGTTKGTKYTKKRTLRAEADRVFEVGWLKVAGFSESGVGDAPAAWAFEKLSDWDSRILWECVPRLAGTEPPDSESPATLSASSRSVEKKQGFSA